MRYLIDSDWTIDALHGIPSALQPLEALTSDGLAVSIITCGEVYEGAFGSPNPEENIANSRVFFSGLTVLGLSDPATGIRRLIW